MTLQELRQKCAALCDRQGTLVNKAITEERAMTPEEKTTYDALQNEIDGLTDLIAKAEVIQARELDKPVDQPFRPDRIDDRQDKKDDAGFNSFGEFLNAVRFGDNAGRLRNLSSGPSGGIEVPEAFRAQVMPSFRNEWSMGVGAEGGFAVPTQFDPNLLMIQPGTALIRPRANVIPAGDPPDAAITIPAYVQGPDGVFGGVQVVWIAEGGQKPETDGKLEEMALTPKEVAAHTVVTDKLLRNWQAAGTFISNLLRGAVDGAEDFAFLRGMGVAQPLGILNGPGVVNVLRAVPGAIAYLDTVNMLAALLPESRERAMYVASQSILPWLMTLQDPAGHYIFNMGDATRAIPPTLNGILCKFTGKNPVAGARGDLMLVDPQYYLIKDGSGPYVSASEHVLFRQNKTIIKIFWNVDGQGWVQNPLTLEDGLTQVSPYVVLV